MKHVVYCSALVLSAGLLVAFQDSTIPDAKSAREYQFKEGFVVTGLGVCAISVDTIDCWDMDGKHDDGLTEKIKAHFLSNYDRDIRLRFGKKNRFLVIQGPPNSGMQITGPTGQYSNQTQISYASGEPAVTMWRSIAEPTETEASVIVKVSGVEPGLATDVPFRKGQKTDFNGATLEIGEVKPLKNMPAYALNYQPSYPYYPGGDDQYKKASYWSIPIGIEQKPNSDYISYSLIDKQGVPLRYVDEKGKPVGSLKFLESMGRNEMGQPVPPRNGGYFAVLFSPENGNVIPGAANYVSNVDPLYIGAIRMSSNHMSSVLLTGFPLDPKP